MLSLQICLYIESFPRHYFISSLQEEFSERGKAGISVLEKYTVLVTKPVRAKAGI